ncbi:MAG: hypothetical protein V3S69_03435 [Dehalococcoidales bacterium]
MKDSQELKIDLSVTVNSDGIEHELALTMEGYTATNIRDIEEIVKEDIDYFVEDLRRRVTIIR